MQHVKALLVKFVMCLAILMIVLGGFYGVSLASILTISVLLTGVSYVVGDLFILPRFENWGATLADFGLSFIGIWVLGYYLFNYTVPLITASVISALLIAGGEYFFHKFLVTRVFDQRPYGAETGIDFQSYQTEFSSEIDRPQDDEDNDNEEN